MGELGANFCRNDFLKSKLNEMDFRGTVLSERLCTVSNIIAFTAIQDMDTSSAKRFSINILGSHMLYSGSKNGDPFDMYLSRENPIVHRLFECSVLL